MSSPSIILKIITVCLAIGELCRGSDRFTIRLKVAYVNYTLVFVQCENCALLKWKVLISFHNDSHALSGVVTSPAYSLQTE